MTTDDRPVLKPCPFCGGSVEMHYTGSSDWEVICKGTCEVETKFWVSAPRYGYGAGEHNEAVARWNRRPAPQPTDDKYVSVVPDHCDRIVWRNRYYGLPISPTPQPDIMAAVDECERLAMALLSSCNRRQPAAIRADYVQQMFNKLRAKLTGTGGG